MATKKMSRFAWSEVDMPTFITGCNAADGSLIAVTPNQGAALMQFCPSSKSSSVSNNSKSAPASMITKADLPWEGIYDTKASAGSSSSVGPSPLSDVISTRTASTNRSTTPSDVIKLSSSSTGTASAPLSCTSAVREATGSNSGDAVLFGFSDGSVSRVDFGHIHSSSSTAGVKGGEGCDVSDISHFFKPFKNASSTCSSSSPAIISLSLNPTANNECLALSESCAKLVDLRMDGNRAEVCSFAGIAAGGVAAPVLQDSSLEEGNNSGDKENRTSNNRQRQNNLAGPAFLAGFPLGHNKIVIASVDGTVSFYDDRKLSTRDTNPSKSCTAPQQPFHSLLVPDLLTTLTASKYEDGLLLAGTQGGRIYQLRSNSCTVPQAAFSLAGNHRVPITGLQHCGGSSSLVGTQDGRFMVVNSSALVQTGFRLKGSCVTSLSADYITTTASNNSKEEQQQGGGGGSAFIAGVYVDASVGTSRIVAGHVNVV